MLLSRVTEPRVPLLTHQSIYNWGPYDGGSIDSRVTVTLLSMVVVRYSRNGLVKCALIFFFNYHISLH